MTSRFDDLAQTIVLRAGELLGAPAVVLDEAQRIVARAATDEGGYREASGSDEQMRVPVTIEGRACDVVVTTRGVNDAVSARLARAVVELIAGQAALVERLPSQPELRNKLVHDLLHGSIADESSARREGQILGIDLTRPRAVMLIDAAGYILAPTEEGGALDDELRIRRTAVRTKLIVQEIVRFFSLPSDAICAYIGDGEVAVLKATSSKDLGAWADRGAGLAFANASWANLSALRRAAVELLTRLRTDLSLDISAGIGRYHPGIRGLARSYEDARIAITLGRRLQLSGDVHSLDRLGVAAFVGIPDSATKAELARHLLSPLDDEPELIDTLRTYFAENCSPSSAADRIPCHRNTLTYRLDKTASLTGLDPRRFDDAVQIKIALVLRSLQDRFPAPPPAG